MSPADFQRLCFILGLDVEKNPSVDEVLEHVALIQSKLDCLLGTIDTLPKGGDPVEITQWAFRVKDAAK